MRNRFAGWLARLGFTRDWAGWLWLRIVSAATLLVSLSTDTIHRGLEFLGMSIPDAWIHRALAAAVVLLWIAGKQDRSWLPSTAEKHSVSVPKEAA
jgi:hypothetical protein